MNLTLFARAQNSALCNMAAAELANLQAHAVGVRKREAGMPSVRLRSEDLNEAGHGRPWQPARRLPRRAPRE